MPTYQYACTDCGHRFEAFQSFSDSALTVCPECGGKLRKVYGSVGVVFKGSGFYRNDARAGGKKSGGGKGSEGSDAAATSTTPSSESSATKESSSTTPAATPKPAATSTSSTSSSSSGTTAG